MSERRFFSAFNTEQLLADRAKQIMLDAQRMPPGVERDRMMKLAREIDVRANLENWANSPGLQPPTRGDQK